MIELFFHHEASPFVRKVLLAADELGVALELRRVELTSKEAMDAYASVNPNRRFPAIRDGALVLWESNAILRYLASAGDAQWLGATRTSAAVVDQWLCWELAHPGPTLLGLQNARLGFLPKPAKDEAALALDAAQTLAVLEAALADRPFVAGDAITLADLALACTFSFAEEAGLLDPRFAAVERWLSSIRSRPSWQRTEQLERDVLAAFGITLPLVIRETSSRSSSSRAMCRVCRSTTRRACTACPDSSPSRDRAPKCI